MPLSKQIFKIVLSRINTQNTAMGLCGHLEMIGPAPQPHFVFGSSFFSWNLFSGSRIFSLNSTLAIIFWDRRAEGVVEKLANAGKKILQVPPAIAFSVNVPHSALSLLICRRNSSIVAGVLVGRILEISTLLVRCGSFSLSSSAFEQLRPAREDFGLGLLSFGAENW